MKRTVVAVVAVSLATTLAPPPASAAVGVAEYRATMTIDCMGCGSSSGTMSGTHTAVVNGSGVVNAPFAASVTVRDPAGPICLAYGDVSGVLPMAGHQVEFSWTRLGAVLLVRTYGTVNGQGTGVMKVSEPLGLPCGGAVTAEVAFTVAGV